MFNRKKGTDISTASPEPLKTTVSGGFQFSRGSFGGMRLKAVVVNLFPTGTHF